MSESKDVQELKEFSAINRNDTAADQAGTSLSVGKEIRPKRSSMSDAQSILRDIRRRHRQRSPLQRGQIHQNPSHTTERRNAQQIPPHTNLVSEEQSLSGWEEPSSQEQDRIHGEHSRGDISSTSIHSDQHYQEPSFTQLGAGGNPPLDTMPNTGLVDHRLDKRRLKKLRELRKTNFLLQTPLQQYKEYVKLQISYSSRNASIFRWVHNLLQTIILVGAALVSISIGFPHAPSWLPPLISGIVTIATAIANYYKFGDRGRASYRDAGDMQREYNWFKSKMGPYKKMNDTEAFEIFQDRTDSLMHDQERHAFAFEEQKEERE